MGQAAGKCLFCGGGNRSKEHIWSRWLGRLISAPEGYEIVDFKQSGFRKPFKADVVRARQGPVTTSTLRVVCQSCNSNWMSRLEEEAKNALTALVMGSQVILVPPVLEAVQRWLTMKLMVMDTDHDPAFTEQEHHQFFDSRQIPANLMIYLGRCGQGIWRSAQHSHGAKLSRDFAKPDRTNVKIIAWGLGELFVLAVYRRGIAFPIQGPGGAVLELGILDPLPIWPPWVLLTETEATSLSRSLARLQHRRGVVAASSLGLI